MKPPKELVKLWYTKLKKSGFCDIEDNKGYNNVSHSHSSHFGSQDGDLIQAKMIYYDQCSDYLHNGTFEKPVHRKVWELHCEGATVREIGKACRFSPFKAHWIICKYRKKAYLLRTGQGEQ